MTISSGSGSGWKSGSARTSGSGVASGDASPFPSDPKDSGSSPITSRSIGSPRTSRSSSTPDCTAYSAAKTICAKAVDGSAAGAGDSNPACARGAGGRAGSGLGQRLGLDRDLERLELGLRRQGERRERERDDRVLPWRRGPLRGRWRRRFARRDRADAGGLHRLHHQGSRRRAGALGGRLLRVEPCERRLRLDVLRIELEDRLRDRDGLDEQAVVPEALRHVVVGLDRLRDAAGAAEDLRELLAGPDVARVAVCRLTIELRRLVELTLRGGLGGLVLELAELVGRRLAHRPVIPHGHPAR